MNADALNGRRLPDLERSIPSVRIELRPHCLLTQSSAHQLFVITCAITLAVSSAAALYGAWPAFVFAGLELLVLRWALRLSLRRGGDAEIIEVTDREVLILVRTGERLTGTSFLRHWARVRLLAAASPSHSTRLLVECQGRKCELGAFLTDNERTETARRLKRLIGRTSESPNLAPQEARPVLQPEGAATRERGHAR